MKLPADYDQWLTTPPDDDDDLDDCWPLVKLGILNDRCGKCEECADWMECAFDG